MSIEERLNKIAATMKLVDRKSGPTADDYYRLAAAHYDNLKRQQEAQGLAVSEEALLQITEKQLAELVRMGRAHKLLRKVDNVRRPSEDGSKQALQEDPHV